MRRLIPLLAVLALLAPQVSAAQAARGDSSAQAPRDPNLPPSALTAKAQLDASPRHGEFVNVTLPGSTTPIRTWVVYPERHDKAGVVLVIMEIYGLSDWLRGVTDQLAREGFIAVAPDLISGLGPGGGGTDSVASRDDVVKLVRTLTPEMTAARLQAVRTWAKTIPSSNGKLGTMGFCWGGARSFECAATSPPPSASVVFYGTSPDSVTLPKVAAPVQGHYGGDDARVDATIAPAQQALKGKPYEAFVYEGAGHGFVRAQEDRDGANARAVHDAWPRAITFLKKWLK